MIKIHILLFSGYPSNVSEQGITNRSKEFNNVGISTLIANALTIVNHNFLNGEKIYLRDLEGDLKLKKDIISLKL